MNTLYEFIFQELKISDKLDDSIDFIEYNLYGNSFYTLKLFLQHYNISSTGIRLEDKSYIGELNFPIIVVYDKRWAVIKKIEGGYVTFSSYGKKISFERIGLDTFIEKWDGTALIVNSTNQVRVLLPEEPENVTNKFNRFKDVAFKGISIVLIALVLFISSRIGVLNLIFLLMNIMGTIVGILLLQKQLHISNLLTDRLCGLVKENSCDVVTESKGAIVLGNIKLSEVVFGYFITNVLFIIFVPGILYWIGIIGLAGLPFTFWSIWYQKFKVKSWCVLCLFTIAILWAQSMTFLFMGVNLFNQLSHFDFFAISICLSYVCLILLTNKAVVFMSRTYEAKHWRQKYMELKLNDKVIDAFKSGAPKFDISVDHCSALIFGNPDAEIILTMFSNPYCAPCANMHNRIKHLPGNCVKVQYVMTYFSEDMADINKYIIAAYYQLGAEETWRILTEWFDQGRTLGKRFFEAMNLDIKNPVVEAEFDKQRKWMNGSPLYGTPTEIVNGCKMMWPYTIEDVYYF